MKMNKKQAGLIAGVACVILLILLLLSMCSGSGNGEVQDEPTQPAETVETTGEAVQPTEVTSEPTEETTEATEETTEPTEEATEPTTGGNSTPGGTSGYNPSYGGSDDDDEETVTETTPAAGSEGSPYTENVAALPDSFSTVTIPTDSTIYHNVNGVHDSVLTIEDAEAYVIYNGTTYEPDENGVVTVAIPAAETEDTPVSFQVGSKSAEARSYVLSFNEPVGSQNNPEIIQDTEGVIAINAVLAVGDEDGYYYQYVAENNGTLTLQVDTITENVVCDIIVAIGETSVKLSDSTEGIVSVNMKAEDQVLIQVVTVPDEDGTYPAAEIAISGTVEDAPGTSGNPIVIFGEFPIVTDTLEPGTEVYYSVYGAGGMILSIEDADAYIIMGEQTYSAVDGVVSLEVVTDNPRNPAIIVVGNGGESAQSYTVNFQYKVGSVGNPAQLAEGTNVATISEGNSDGYWYTWTAEADGILTITMPEGNWMYMVNNLTASAYGDAQYSDSDPVVNPAEIEVAEGDELSIMVSSYDPANPFGVPAGQVVFTAAFNTTVGTKDNPIWLTELENTVQVKPGYSVYCNEVLSNVTMVVTGEGAFTVTCNGTNYVAVDGAVTIPNVNGSRWAPVPVILSNNGTEAATYTVTFTYPLGSSSNPQILEELGEYTAAVVGDGEGYFYNWTASADGELTVSMKGDDWTFVVNNMTSYTYGAIHTSSDGDAASETVEVKAGDLIQINVGTASRQNKDVVLEIDFYDPTYGTEENPVWLTELENTVTVRPGSMVYCNVVLSGVTMTVAGDGDFTVTCDGVGYPTVNGVATISDLNGSRWTPVQLILVNSGEKKTNCTIEFAYPVGSSSNPEVIGEMGEYTADVVGDGEGYFYNWTAAEDGELTVSMKSEDWTYVINNLTTYAYGSIHASTSGDEASMTLSVKAGNLIQINIGTASRKDKEVVIDVSFQAAAAAPVDSHAEASAEVEQETAAQDSVAYEGEHTPTNFNLHLNENQELVRIDLAEIYSLKKDAYGYYHLDSENGPLVLMDFTDDTFVNLAELLEDTQITCQAVAGDGTVTTQSCNELLERYIECADATVISEDITQTLYPLTEDLMVILQNVGDQLGWYASTSSGYLFDADPALEEDTLWMFACSYVETTEEEEEQTEEELVESGEEDSLTEPETEADATVESEGEAENENGETADESTEESAEQEQEMETGNTEPESTDPEVIPEPETAPETEAVTDELATETAAESQTELETKAEPEVITEPEEEATIEPEQEETESK